MEWRGKRNGGVTKKQLADNIAILINSKGVHLKRNGAQIQSKIEHMEKQFRVAHDFANSQTGAGIE